VDRFSNKSVLRVCGPAYILCVLGWTFTTLPGLAPWGVLALLAVLHVAMGVASAGVTLATGNIGLKLAPSGLATSYLATNSLVSAMAAGIAPIIGGATADFFAWRELSAIVRWISPHGMTAFFVMDVQHWGFFFLFAFIIGVYAGHRLFLVREDGEVKETVVVQELVSNAMRDLRSFSPVSQLQSVLEFPIRTVGRRLKQLRQYRYIRTRIISLGSLGDR
jgi:MFS family permease